MLGWSSSDVQACTSRIKRHVNTGDKDDGRKIKGQQEPKVKQALARRPAAIFKFSIGLAICGICIRRQLCKSQSSETVAAAQREAHNKTSAFSSLSPAREIDANWKNRPLSDWSVDPLFPSTPDICEEVQFYAQSASDVILCCDEVGGKVEMEINENVRMHRTYANAEQKSH
ncbi:DNA-directed RNA polymerase II subunit [Trichinella spiralis]|uniref:DNA-directed RNA polymerase II subunit n=1 Tax=Trichinella spiralis TaxID=6334 RepID=A0ABR3KX38_TRISP